MMLMLCRQQEKLCWLMASLEYCWGDQAPRPGLRHVAAVTVLGRCWEATSSAPGRQGRLVGYTHPAVIVAIHRWHRYTVVGYQLRSCSLHLAVYSLFNHEHW
eukprot:GHUV01040023.1.p1 GENE.GHUV01040023.1~~GHUV01040023.1.p1  ORF type:complete len:102 (+),score=18.77 GHUV01040023.1:479-784(+)